jgi:dinuclear metal center YbgI/SA1388 family protein
MSTVADLCQFLESFAPPTLGEDWDNVGLLVGDRAANVTRVMTCLTITPASAAEAVREKANAIVAHHPLPFHPLKRLTTDTTTGRMLLSLIAAGIAVYSPHTAFDSSAAGINQGLAEGLGLVDIQPLELPRDANTPGGVGRWGRLQQTEPLAKVAQRLKVFLKVNSLQVVGENDAPIRRIAVGCGSAGKFLDHALRLDCQLFVTGEASFHTCLEAEARNVSLLLPGHYASERFAVERLADHLTAAFPQLHIWASRDERDPLRWG